MKKIPFLKMSGSGNDFILIDNRNSMMDKTQLKGFISKVCRRAISVGADGLILIENPDEEDVQKGLAHFKWHYYNADGGEAEMCGNGSRCAARFAYLKGIAPKIMAFRTLVGIIKAEMISDCQVKVQMSDPKDLRLNFPIDIDGETRKVHFVNSGVPHVVHFLDRIDSIDVFNLGRKTRYHQEFQPAGTNADFAEVLNRHTLKLRTYERGIENETLACGTGAVATALIASELGMAASPVEVQVRSGEILKIYFEKRGDQFIQVFMQGEVRVVYEGEMWEEAWA
jgi:diaminopimelate epimerase